MNPFDKEQQKYKPFKKKLERNIWLNKENHSFWQSDNRALKQLEWQHNTRTGKELGIGNQANLTTNATFLDKTTSLGFRFLNFKIKWRWLHWHFHRLGIMTEGFLSNLKILKYLKILNNGFSTQLLKHIIKCCKN